MFSFNQVVTMSPSVPMGSNGCHMLHNCVIITCLSLPLPLQMTTHYFRNVYCILHWLALCRLAPCHLPCFRSWGQCINHCYLPHLWLVHPWLWGSVFVDHRFNHISIGGKVGGYSFMRWVGWCQGNLQTKRRQRL